MLVDGDYVLSESRAIAIYLTEKNYPNGHSLYPVDAKKRGIVNQRIFFDSTVLFPRIRAICVSCIFFDSFYFHCMKRKQFELTFFSKSKQRPALYSGITKIADKDRQDLFDAVDYVDKNFFKGNQFIAGTEQPTLGDLSILASIATFVVSIQPL